MKIQYSGMPTDVVRRFQAGANDAYGNPPEQQVSDGSGNQCRHCLHNIPEGAGMLVLAYRPFDGLHPYAETGPIFLCSAQCDGFGSQPNKPPTLTTSPEFLLKGYGRDNRIVYGTGAVIAADRVSEHSKQIFSDAKVTYIHVRSARNNCYQARIDRG